MKTTFKTSRTLKPYPVTFGGYTFTVPEGSRVSNSTACGNDDAYYFWQDWKEMAKKLTGSEDSILAHDLRHYGLSVPVEYCRPYKEQNP